MGQSNSGVIYNDSDFDIKYYITSHFSQIVLTNETNEVNPELQLDVFGGAKIRGWRKATNTLENCFQNVQTYEVLAGRLSTTGLSNLQLNTSFITIKAVIGKYEKLLIGNCPIKSLEDIRYKIRNDLSCRQIKDDKQAQEYIKMATQRTAADNSNAIKVAPERQQRRKKYLEELQRLHATQVSKSKLKTSNQKMKRSSP